MRLSHGFVRGETLACIYHGWRYGTTGACEHIPAHPALTPPKSVTATPFSCVESNGLIWVTADENPGEPPSIAATEPLRSLNIAATPSQIASHLGQDPKQILIDGDLTLILQATDENYTNIHTFCTPNTDKKAASRGLESLRRSIEKGLTDG